jgi:cytochrome c-type biogenesis protein CcmE
LLAVGIVALAIGYLVFSSVRTSSAYYVTVGELKAASPALTNKKLRVAGTVVGDSIQWDARRLVLDFELADASGRLPVTYKGARPDMFRDGAEAVVEGKYANNALQATNLLLKCPSKYQEAAATPAAQPNP